MSEVSRTAGLGRTSDDVAGLPGMDDSAADPAAKRAADRADGTPARAPMSEVTRRQRLVVIAAGVAVLVALLIGGSMDAWSAGLFAAIGVVLALGNALLTEAGMIRMTSTGQDLSRKQFALSAFGRLAVISLVAVVLVLAFWPIGGFVLAGLAVFQLLTIVVTALPLLKELRHS